MGMASATRQVLRETFLDLLEVTPLDQITVRDLVRACGVSRNTFYYHYHDLHHLVEEILSLECERLAEVEAGTDGIEAALTEAFRLPRAHQRALMRLYHSQDHDRVVSFAYTAAESVMRGIVERSSEGRVVEPGDVDVALRLLTGMVEATLMGVIRGEATDIDDFVARSCTLLAGVADLMLDNAVAAREQER